MNHLDTIPKNLTKQFNNYVLNLRQENHWVPEAAEHIFLELLTKNQVTQQLLKKDLRTSLGVSETTLTRSLALMEKGGFIKITSKPRMGTIITINNLLKDKNL